MYEAFIICLDAIGMLEPNWDTKAMGDAYGLMRRITDPTFIASFQTVLYFFGYTKGLSKKLQGSSIDIVDGYGMVDTVKTVLSNARQDDSVFYVVFQRVEHMAELAGLSSFDPPRICGRQTQRNNVPAETTQQYYKRAIFIPYLDSLLQQFNMRFSHLTSQAHQAISLLPSHISETTSMVEEEIFNFYQDDLQYPETFGQELNLWRQMWLGSEEKSNTIHETLGHRKCCGIMFPNICKILTLLLLTSVTESEVERANSALKFVKTAFRSTMGEDRLNALVLMSINMYAQRHPRRMILFNPLSDPDH